MCHELVTILKPSQTAAASGAVRSDWSAPIVVCERFANPIPKTTQRYERFYTQHQTATAAYEMAGYTECRPGWRLVHGDQTMEIIGVETENNVLPVNAQWLTLMVRTAR